MDRRKDRQTDPLIRRAYEKLANQTKGTKARWDKILILFQLEVDDPAEQAKPYKNAEEKEITSLCRDCLLLEYEMQLNALFLIHLVGTGSE